MSLILFPRSRRRRGRAVRWFRVWPAVKPSTAPRWTPRSAGSATAPSGSTWSTWTRPSGVAPTGTAGRGGRQLDVGRRALRRLPRRTNRCGPPLATAAAGQPRHRGAGESAVVCRRDRRARRQGGRRLVREAGENGDYRLRGRGWETDGRRPLPVLDRLVARAVRDSSSPTSARTAR